MRIPTIPTAGTAAVLRLLQKSLLPPPAAAHAALGRGEAELATAGRHFRRVIRPQTPQPGPPAMR